jgi:NAD(P)-dependent dehydrogenase (short-subunit alcohol dehydrogenase family)
MKIDQRTVLVTGGSSGLGEGTVRTLVAGGANVVIADVNRERGEALASELGDQVRFAAVDVADEESTYAAVRVAVDSFGGLHGAVNCAGIGSAGRVLGRDGALPLAAFTRTIQVNLVGTFNVIRLAAEAMAGNEPNEHGERGVVVNTASVAAFDGQIGQAAYSASKGGVVGMTLPLARDLARHGIRVVTIAPGIFETPMVSMMPDNLRKSLSDQVPFPARFGQPSEFAALVQHIFENPFLNGETIRLDGAVRMAPR